ncbi:hypothetical protein [Moorena sp. SIO3H5]|nr:hypothetical protein [Moorena sp. SIO3H5]
MVGFIKPNKLRIYDLRIGKQKLGMVIPNGQVDESRRATRGEFNS